MARGCKRSLSDFSHLHQPLEPQGVFLARWGRTERQSTTWKILLLGFTQQTSRNSLTWLWLFSIIYPKQNPCWKKNRTRTAWMQPFSPRHFFRGPPPLFPICNNPALSFRLILTINVHTSLFISNCSQRFKNTFILGRSHLNISSFCTFPLPPCIYCLLKNIDRDLSCSASLKLIATVGQRQTCGCVQSSKKSPLNILL